MIPSPPPRARAPSRLAGGLVRRLAALVLLGIATAAPAQSLYLDRALAAEVPVDAAAPGRVRDIPLPDDWARTRPGRPGPVWYRVTFDAAPRAGDELLALYVERVCSNLAVALNGELVHSGGRMREPITNHCHHPQLVPLPTALLRERGNTLDIQVAGHALAAVASRHRAGALSALEIGPLSALQPRHARQTALRATLPQAVGATLLLMGGFMFVLGFFNRRESHLAYFGAVSVGWAIVDARLWLRELPLPQFGAELLLSAMLALIAWMAVQFLLRYAQCRLRTIDLLLPLQSVLVPLTLIGAGPSRLFAAASVWDAVLALEVLAAAAFYLHRQWRNRSVSFWLMGALIGIVALAALVELAAQVLGARGLAPEIARIVAPMMLVLVGLRLVQQHGRALQVAEAGRAHLELRIREATAEIERNFRQIAELKIEQVTERERKRIAADLHDDLGAKLLTIVHTSDSERISTLAREALEEMRLSVRGLTGKAVRLADALGDWRAETVSRLAQAGIESNWSAPEELPQTLSARAYVQTTRILREATSNIIKHSGASYCEVRCQVADGDFQLVVQDNGGGIRAESEARLDRGHGMASMKQRAKQMQGQCLIESGPGYGTVMRLTLPLDRALENA